MVLRARIVLLAAEGHANTPGCQRPAYEPQEDHAQTRPLRLQRLASLAALTPTPTAMRSVGRAVKRVVEVTTQVKLLSGSHWGTRSLARHHGLSKTAAHRTGGSGAWHRRGSSGNYE
jgi:hypothetical protein